MRVAQKLKILFLCTGNSCRSQMAEGWTRKLKGDYIEVYFRFDRWKFLMAHNHAHTPTKFNRAFAIGTILNLLFVVIEAGYGSISHTKPRLRSYEILVSDQPSFSYSLNQGNDVALDFSVA